MMRIRRAFVENGAFEGLKQGKKQNEQEIITCVVFQFNFVIAFVYCEYRRLKAIKKFKNQQIDDR